MSPENPRTALMREATRLHGRYQEEVVERFSVCPWAKAARIGDRLRTHVVVDAKCHPLSLDAVVDGWADDPRVEVAFIIAPRFEAGATAFATWTETVGRIRSDVFLTASFHPDAEPTAGPVHFLRQTPDPTAQLVRRARLEEIRSQDPPHYADIFNLDLRQLQSGKPPRAVAASVLAHNDRLLAGDGRAILQRIIDEIREDRKKTYARIFPVLRQPEPKPES